MTANESKGGERKRKYKGERKEFFKWAPLQKSTFTHREI
jgi:hypothetical protein